MLHYCCLYSQHEKFFLRWLQHKDHTRHGQQANKQSPAESLARVSKLGCATLHVNIRVKTSRNFYDCL